MSESEPQQPLKGVTPGQLRALAAIAQRRGWDRPTLRAIVGVKRIIARTTSRRRRTARPADR